MKEYITRSHIGKRLLLTDRHTRIDRTEVEVLELSPSGKNVKLHNINAGTTYWQEADEDVIVEVLQSVVVNANDEPRRT